MDNLEVSVDKRPWYREPYVWMLITFPASAVIVGIVMLQVAIRTYDGLVVDDYYKRGLEINRTLARDKAAQAHGLDGSLRLDGAKKLLELELRSAAGYPPPQFLELQLSHATRAGFDQLLSLERIGNGVYQTALPELVAGAWQLQLSADDWRLLGTLSTPGPQSQVVALRPEPTE